MIKKTVQKEIIHFFELIGKPKMFTKSAFTQSRAKLKPKAYYDLNETLIEEFYADKEIKLWEGFRLIGIDGSSIILPNSKEIIAEFGVAKNQSKSVAPMAKISTCFDILNQMIIDPIIIPYKKSEYDMMLEHIKKLKKEDLLIFDRGYSAIWVFLLLIRAKIDFLIRIPTCIFKDFWENESKSTIKRIETCSEKSKITIKKRRLKFKRFNIRLIKVFLENGETEVLATSLMDDRKYPDDIFKNLYMMRWDVEGNYNHLKNHLEVENFSGKTIIAIKQDFYANAFIENIRSLLAQDANEEVKGKKKNAKYEYKVNRNLSLGLMKDEIVKLLMSDDPNYYRKIEKLFTIEPVPIRPNRHVKRIFHHPRGKRYHMNYRRSL